VFDTHLALSPEAGLMTAMLALRLSNSSVGVVLAGSAPAGCRGPDGGTYTPFTAAVCSTVSGGWYAVLVLPNASIANVFGAPGAWTGPTTELSGAQSLYLVSATNLTGTYDELVAFGTGPASVVGSTLL
jgi:hypothetical protein